MAKRHEMYNAQLDYIHSQALTGNTLIIAPVETTANRPHRNESRKMRLVYGMGRDSATAMLPQLKSFLDGK